MGRAIPSTHFSTSDLPATDRFDAWRDKIAVIFDVDRIGGADGSKFEANVDAYQIGHLVVTDSRQGEQAYSLSARRTRAADMDLIQVGLYRSGGYRGDANGRSIGGKPGDLQVLDLARPMRSVEAASDMVCVFLPREILQDQIGDLDALHGCDLDSEAGRLLADHIGLLATRLPQMSESDGEAAAGATVDMTATCLRPSAAAMHRAQAPIRDVILLRAKRLIEENLGSPKLTPDFLCRTLGVSRRSLYRVFEPLDGIHQFILRRRLSQIMKTLNDPNNRQRIADVAERYGFACQETFWRAFKRQYSVTPGDVRSDNVRRQHGLPDGGAGFDRWLQQLHA